MIDLLGADPMTSAGQSNHGPSLETIASLIEAGVAQVEYEEKTRTQTELDIGLRELAHDLRSPLGASMLLVDRMRRGISGPLTVEMDRHLQLLQSAVTSMVRIIDDAFLLTQISKTLTLQHVECFAPTELFADVRALAQPLAEEKQLMLRFSSGLTGQCRGNRPLLQRIVLNLVVNALQNTDTGGVTVLVETVDANRTRISVLDSGKGVRADIVEWLCGEAVDTPRGVGIGLKLCKDLTSRVGATLAYRGLPDGGSCFDVILPQPTES